MKRPIFLIKLLLFYLHITAQSPSPAVRFDGIAAGTLIAAATYPSPTLGPVDAVGNIYAAHNNRVSRISPSGVESIIAGTGASGYSDGPEAAAQFRGAAYTALDAAGNIYVSDVGNNVIRKITPGGTVSTFAGNGNAGKQDSTGTAASFNAPQGITLDAAGNLYVCDKNNNLIRKITAAGVVSTFASFNTPGAQFSDLTDITIDPAGNLYVLPLYGQIQKITPAGQVSTIYPPGFLGFKQGLASDKSGNLYVSILHQNVSSATTILYKIFPGGNAAPLAGSGTGYADAVGEAAQFNAIRNLSIDMAGNIFISDSSGIRKLSKPALSFTGHAGAGSPAKYFTVSGNYLSGSATLLAPAGYELSLTETGPYTATLVLPSAAGEILVRKIYIRLGAGALAGVYNDSVLLTAAGAVTQKLGISGTITNSPKKLVIIGSGTSACSGLDTVAACYLGRLNAAYNKLAPFDTAIDNHLAQGGLNCYNGMPSSYVSPYPPGSAYRPLDNINITAALALNPDAILINYPGNGYDELSVNEIMYCLRTIRDSANKKGVPCYVTTTQPRVSPASFNTSAVKLKLAILKDSIMAAFGMYAIDFYTGMINPSDSSLLYDSGDHINMNAAGHAILAQRVQGRNIFTPAGTDGAGGTGLLGNYYSNIDMMGAPSFTRVDPVINNDFVSTSPAPGILSQNYYSVRWTGQIQALFSEAYVFYAFADDGIRVTVNGVKLVDSWLKPVASEQSNTINLMAGEKYDIIVEYYQNVDRAISRLSWSSASTPKAIVPQSQLYPPSAFSAFDGEIEVFRAFINANGSLTPVTAAVRPVITLGTFSPGLAGASVMRNDSRIRYIGGHTVENYDNIQPGNYPKNLFTTAKNVSFSSTERSAIGSVVEFDITCPKFEIFEYEDGGGIRVLVDNQIAGGYSYGATGDLNYRLFDFSAINASPVKRHIRLEYSDKAVMGGLKLDTIGALLPLQDVVSYRICWLGDSFTEGTGVASNQALHAGLAAYSSKILGFRDYRMSGFGGTGYNVSFNPGFNSVRPSLADRINYDGINADVFVLAMGLNDRDSDTALAGKITSTLDNLRATNPASLIFVLGPYGNGSGGNIKPTVENKIITAAANRLGVKFISVYDIAFTKSDATHPDAAGHVRLGTVIASRIKARVGIVDTSLQTPVTGKGTGLKGLYLNYDPNLGKLPDTSVSNIYLERIDSTIDFEFTYSKQPLVLSPAPGIVPVDSYSVRWTGQVQPMYSETYTFYTVSDDGVRLWVNGVQLVNNWVNQGSTENSGIINLVAGQKYDIKIEYYENTGESVTKLYWSSASTPKAIVPKSQLFPAGTVIPSVPSCATNTLPLSGATIATQTTAALTWTTAATATSYDVYLWTGATVPASPTTNTTGTTYSITGLVAGTLYNWFVVPKNANGPATGCSNNKTSFTTAVTAPTGGGTGLHGAYYNGIALSGTPLLTRIDPVINFEMTYSQQPQVFSPAPGIVPVDLYSVRWTGQVQALFSETYTFYTVADDGIRLWVNGVQLVNNWVNQGATERSGSITLVAGQKYNIVIEYYENTGESVAKLFWSSASTAKAIVPQAQLFLPGAAARMMDNRITAANKASLQAGANAVSFAAGIYPNPVKSGQPARLQITSSKTGTALVTVISSNGYRISNRRLTLVAGVNTTSINTAGLAQGLYLINVTGGDKPVTFKLVIE